LTARASIDQVGSFKRNAAGDPVLRGWSFDCHGDPAIKGLKGLTYAHDAGGRLVPSHIAGWSINELEAIARDHIALRCGLVTPELLTGAAS
jgi:hypothetical protein